MSSSRRRSAAGLAADTSGLAAIEFAFVSPLLILLLLGAIQIGWAVHCAASVRWALDASARALMINPSLTASDVRSAMVARLAKVADAEDLEVTVTPDEAEQNLVVESTYTTSLAFPMMSLDTLTFKSRVTVPNPGEGS